MGSLVTSALLVHTRETAALCERLQNQFDSVHIDTLDLDDLMENPAAILSETAHVVVAGDLETIKAVLDLAVEHKFSVGIVPTPQQNDLMRYYNLPGDADAALELALQAEAPAMDICRCNGKILLFKATIGRIPLLDVTAEQGRLQTLLEARKQFSSLRLGQIDIVTDSGRKIKTAACGCMIIQHHMGSLASRMIAHDSSPADGMISMAISAPKSIMAYLGFLGRLLTPYQMDNRLPEAIGYIKTSRIDLKTQISHNVWIDGEVATQTPLLCETLPGAVRINIGPRLLEPAPSQPGNKEIVSIDNLPRDKELIKAQKKKVPLFSYASEERFRELFISLRTDARIDRIYLTLMVLSTMLATIGLYLNSSSVIIGAMLLAPLMAPIVSLAMGILRNDRKMLNNSFTKVLVGIAIALMASSLIALLFPHEPVTSEMRARLNPTLLDLAVAILSGVAGAYSKSFREIIQSLAGVAIAVALVPPLAVAGTGIGRLDFHFFFQAFLLFNTNLIGIVLAASFTFRVLGYSAAIRSKRHLTIVLLLSVLIAVPLYLSYERIVDKAVYEKSWRRERFLVNEKYIIIQNAHVSRQGGKQIIAMDLLAREPLTRSDLNELRRKIQANFPEKLVIRARTIYIP